MLFKIDEQLSYLEETANIQLREGDLLMSGTPEGIAPVREGDHLLARISEEGRVISEINEQIVRELSPKLS